MKMESIYFVHTKGSAGLITALQSGKMKTESAASLLRGTLTISQLLSGPAALHWEALGDAGRAAGVAHDNGRQTAELTLTRQVM